MVALDRILGVAEWILVPASLIWLFVAVNWPDRRLALPVALTLAVGLTIAQPFGIVAHSQENLPPASARAVDPDSVHIVEGGLGLPLLPFKLYSRPNIDVLHLENHPTETLRARSWFWGPFLTNSTKISDICGNVFEDPPCASVLSTSLRLVTADGNYWITIPNPSYSKGAAIPRSFTWKLGVGITSVGGVAYWLVGGILLLRARSKRSRA